MAPDSYLKIFSILVWILADIRENLLIQQYTVYYVAQIHDTVLYNMPQSMQCQDHDSAKRRNGPAQCLKV
jgi:hypothetical protein